MSNCNYECVSAVRVGDQVHATVRVTVGDVFDERSFTTHVDNDLKAMCEHVCLELEHEMEAVIAGVDAPATESIDVSKLTLDPVSARAAAEKAD